MSFDSLPIFHSPARLLVMLSGSGTTLMNLLKHIERRQLHATIPLVVASRECLGAQRARDAGIETHIHTNPIDPDWLDALFGEYEIDLVILAGYLQLLPITDRLAHRVINIHPALLPSFGGRGMHGQRVHQAVVEAAQRGEVDESGCTVHFADEHYDTGSIILQRRCPVHTTDCAHKLADRVFELECQAYPQAINLLIQRNAQANQGE